jgi:hypothetical protein
VACVRHGRQFFSAPNDRTDSRGQSTSANLAGGVEIEAATACEDTEARGGVPDIAFSPTPSDERSQKSFGNYDGADFDKVECRLMGSSLAE